ncbi:MAG: hypothetical protein EAX86_03115 [Candidatus Heimdallarchaeota archaeon]|nr:hypothetical protein [Candidatus Heimdallarchaeota archaeon]
MILLSDSLKVRITLITLLICTFSYSQTFFIGFSSNNFENWHLYQISAKEAWKYTRGENVTIAVIDSGIDFTHPELNMSSWINTGEIPNNSLDDDMNGFIDDFYGWDFVNNDANNGFDEFDPIHSHGTFIAGLISGKDDGEGITGIASSSKIMSIRVLDISNTLQEADWLVNAIHYAIDNGADIISISIEMPLGTPNLQDSIKRAKRFNIPVISSAGNYGGESVAYPAAYSEVIAVGATNFNQEKADYSNYGEELDMMAPVGEGAILITSTNLGGGYRTGSGTSFASPQVAAIAGLIRSINSTIPVDMVQYILESTAKDINIGGKDNQTGFGIVNATAAILKTLEFQQDIQTNNRFNPFGIRFELLISLSAIFVFSFRSRKRKI